MNKNFGKSSIRRMMGANLPDRLTDIEQKLRERPIKSLRQLADLLPVLVGSRIISPVSSDNVDPEDAAFSGSGLAGDPITIADALYSIFDIINGELNFGVIPGQGFVGAGGKFRVTKDAVYFGDTVVFSFEDGFLYAIAAQIMLNTTNFNKILSLSGAGGFSPLGTGAAAGAIYCMVKLGTDIFFGGSFLQMGGVRSPYFIKWDGSAFSKPYIGELNGAVLSMAVVGTDIYLGGVFTKNYTSATTGGASSTTPALVSGDSGGSGSYELLNYIGKYNGTTVLGLNYLTSYGANGAIRALAVNGTTLYAGGDFTTMLGTSATRVCAIDTTGPTASALSWGLDGTCYSLIYSTDLYAGGAFTDKVRRYSAGVWAAWGTSGPNNTVYGLAKTGNDLYAVGAFTSPASYIGKTTSGGAWGAVGAGLAGIGYAVAIDGANIIAGFAGGENVQYYDGTWHSLGSGVNSSVYSLLVDTTWLIGGIYTTADGGTIYRISRYSTSTAPTAMLLQTAMDMLDDHSHYMPLGGHFGGTVAAGATNIGSAFYVGGVTAANEATIQVPLRAGTLYGLQVYLRTAQPGTGSLVITVRKNGADTGVVLTIAAGAGAGVKSVDTTVAWAADDLFTISVLNNAASASGSLASFSALLKVSNL